MENRRWVMDETERQGLYFTPFYEEVLYAVLYCEDGAWLFDSAPLEKYREYLLSDTLEGAKGEVEQYIAGHFESEVEYYTDMLRKWEAGA